MKPVIEYAQNLVEALNGQQSDIIKRLEAFAQALAVEDTRVRELHAHRSVEIDADAHRETDNIEARRQQRQNDNERALEDMLGRIDRHRNEVLALTALIRDGSDDGARLIAQMFAPRSRQITVVSDAA